MKITRRTRRRIALLVILPVLMLVGVVLYRAVSAAQHQRLAAQARREGLAAFARGDVEEALRNFSYYFQTERDDLEVDQRFAEARLRRPLPNHKHLYEAIDLYANYCLKLLDRPEAPTDRDARRLEVMHRLVDLYGQLGLHLELINMADRALAAAPNDRDALAAKAETLLINRRFDEALPLAQRLIELEPDDLGWRRLHLELLSGQGMGNPELIEQCRRWAQEYQGDCRFHLLTASMFEQMDQVDEAVVELRLVAEQGASNAEILQRAVDLMDILDQRELADHMMAAAIARAPDQAWVREVAVRRLWKSDDIGPALAALESARHDLPQFSPALQRLEALTLLSANQPAKAAEVIRCLVESTSKEKSDDADRTWVQALAASLDATESHWREAMQALDNAIALSPRDPVLHYLLGDAFLRMGEQNRALEEYRKANALDPAWMAAGLAWGDALLDAGRFDEAYRASRQVLARARKDHIAPQLLHARAWLAARQSGGSGQLPGDPADIGRAVIEVLRQIHAGSPAHPQAAAMLVEALAVEGDRTGALETARSILNEPQATADVMLALAEVSRRLSLGVEAELIAKAREIGGPTMAVVFAQAQLHADRQEAQRGLEVIDRAIAAAGDSPQAIPGRIERVRFLLQMQHPLAESALRSLVNELKNSAAAQQFALAQRATWRDEALLASVIANLRALLGDHSQQVRLAQAGSLLKFHAQQEPQLARAMVLISGVLEQSPDSLAALSMMADAMLAGEHPSPDRAIESLERAIDVHPGRPELMARLIALQQRQGRFDAAGRCLRRLAELNGHEAADRPEGLDLRSVELRLWQSQGDFEPGLARAAALVTETSPVADQLVLALMQRRAGQVDRAEQTYQRLLAQPAPDPLVRIESAEFYATTARFEQGMRVLEQLPEDNGSPMRTLALARYQQRHGDPATALALFKQAVERSPESGEAHEALAGMYLAQQDRAKAHDEAMAGLQIDPNHAGLRMIVAIANLGSDAQARSKAIAALKDLGGRDDDLLATLTLLQQVRVKDGRSQPSDVNLADARKLIEEHGRFLPAWQLAITLHVEAEKNEQAIDLARRAVSRLPAEAQPAQWAVELLSQAGHWNEALAEAQEWRRRTLDDPFTADMAIAGILLELRRPGDAVAQLSRHADRLATHDHVTPQHLALWMRALLLVGQYEKAAALAAPLMKDDAQWRAQWLAFAAALDDSHAYEALALAESAASNQPEELLRIAAQWIELGKRGNRAECFDRADALADRAAEEASSKTAARIVLAMSAEARGQLDKAETIYREVRTVDPDNITALNNLAFILARSPQRCAEALELIQRAMHLQPDHPDVLDTYARALLGLDRRDEAEQALAKAFSLRPDDASIGLSLAETRLSMDRLPQAQQALDEVQRRWDDQSRTDSQLRQRLDDLRKRLREALLTTGT